MRTISLTFGEVQKDSALLMVSFQAKQWTLKCFYHIVLPDNAVHAINLLVGQNLMHVSRITIVQTRQSSTVTAQSGRQTRSCELFA